MDDDRTGEAAGRGWRSWHLHAPAFEQRRLDRLVTHVVGPAAEWVARAAPGAPWFFVRYWQRGPHVRLRVRGLDAEVVDLLTDRLRAWFAWSDAAVVLPDEATVDEADYRATVAPVARAGEGDGPLPVLPLRAPGVYADRYEPEVTRYGSGDLLSRSEELFHVSSAVVLGLLRRRPSDAARAGFALRAGAAAVAEVQARVGEPVLGAATGESLGVDVDDGDLRAWVEPQLAALRRRGGLDELLSARTTGPFLPWSRALAAAAPAWREAPAGIPGVLFSHLHMLHNRLGIPGETEALHYALLAALLAGTPAVSPASAAPAFGVPAAGRR